MLVNNPVAEGSLPAGIVRQFTKISSVSGDRRKGGMARVHHQGAVSLQPYRGGDPRRRMAGTHEWREVDVTGIHRTM
ncbi:MAG TPA: hypothetical protein ACQGQI_08290 [Xylella sp.]